jgi:hypothetical protein
MKIRLGFVSNSSSSSYTCDICNTTESGWDLGLSEVGMKQCVNGHTFCEGHGAEWEPTWQEKKEAVLSSYWIKREPGKELRPAIEAAQTALVFNHLAEEHNLEWLWEERDSGYDVPSSACPICTFGKVHERDAFLYLLKVAGRTEADLLTELRERFGTYEEMKKWLKE